MRTERNSANALRVNEGYVRELEKQIAAEVAKLAKIQGGGNAAADKAAFTIEARIARLNDKINRELAKAVTSGK